MTTKKMQQQLKKVMTLLYELEDQQLYKNKGISQAINILQKTEIIPNKKLIESEVILQICQKVNKKRHPKTKPLNG